MYLNGYEKKPQWEEAGYLDDRLIYKGNTKRRPALQGEVVLILWMLSGRWQQGHWTLLESHYPKTSNTSIKEHLLEELMFRSYSRPSRSGPMLSRSQDICAHINFEKHCIAGVLWENIYLWALIIKLYNAISVKTLSAQISWDGFNYY